MADHPTLDRAFASVTRRSIDTGQAPYYAELAADLGGAPETRLYR